MHAVIPPIMNSFDPVDFCRLRDKPPSDLKMSTSMQNARTFNSRTVTFDHRHVLLRSLADGRSVLGLVYGCFSDISSVLSSSFSFSGAQVSSDNEMV